MPKPMGLKSVNHKMGFRLLRKHRPLSMKGMSTLPSTCSLEEAEAMKKKNDDDAMKTVVLWNHR